MDFDNATKLLQEAYDSHSDFIIEKLSKDCQDAIESIILGDHLTFRYVLLTALLAKNVDSKIHMRSLQAKAKFKHPYDARSLCHKVIVPFEKATLEGRLGDSNEPFLNKPARFPLVFEGDWRGGQVPLEICKSYRKRRF